jgi:CRP/FNR family transcriptional regulator
VFLIKEGRVRVYMTTPSGKEATLDLLDGGTVLWARRLEAVDGRAVQTQAVGATELAFMGRGDLDRVVLKKPEVGLRMMELLAERLGESNERMTEITSKAVLPRLASQVLRQLESEGLVGRKGGQTLPSAYTHEELGAMIGAGRGGRGAEAAAHPREGPRGPAEPRRSRALARHQPRPIHCTF